MLSKRTKQILLQCEDCSLGELEDIQWLIARELEKKREKEISPDLVRDLEEGGGEPEEDDGLALDCQKLLRTGIELTQAEQGLLAAVVLSDLYHSASFASRRINNVIEESARKRISNITSALSGLIGNGYLVSPENKKVALTEAGRSKAEALVHLKFGPAGENAE